MRLSIKGEKSSTIDVEISEDQCSISVGWNGFYKMARIQSFQEAGNDFIRVGKILLLLDELKRLNKINVLGEINPRPFRGIMDIIDDLKTLGFEVV